MLRNSKISLTASPQIQSNLQKILECDKKMFRMVIYHFISFLCTQDQTTF